jgi:hypothetical protein
MWFRRNLVVAAVLVGVAAARPGTTWLQVGGDGAHTSASGDTVFSTSNVSPLRVTAQLQGPFAPSVPPAISQDREYSVFPGFGGGFVEGDSVALYTGRPADGTVQQLFLTPGTIGDQPVLDKNAHRLWVIDSTGTLYAFDATCTSSACMTPVATAHVGSCTTTCTASPFENGSTVVAVTSDGSLAAYSASCHGTCSPVWTANVGTNAHSTPTDGGSNTILVGSSTGSVEAFRSTCHGACAPIWTSPSGDTSSDTVAYDAASGIAYWESADGHLYGAYGCTTGVCAPSIVLPLGAGPLATRPVIDDADQNVFALLPTGVLTAWRIAPCASVGPCVPKHEFNVTLFASTAGSQAAVANGVLWVGDTIGFVHAVATAGCGGAATCSELLPPNPHDQLTTLNQDGMSAEIGDGAVWFTDESSATGYAPWDRSLLTAIVPG